MNIQQVQISSYGSADVLQLTTGDIPSLQNNEVLIKVQAIGVNYSDILRRRNTYFMPTPLPYILGVEAVGIIEELGEGVSANGLAAGQRVLAILPNGGAYAEYIAADSQYCIPLPPSIDSLAATALFVQGSTAHLLIHQIAADIKGKSILVHAGAGGVGSLLIQLGKTGRSKSDRYGKFRYEVIIRC